MSIYNVLFDWLNDYGKREDSDDICRTLWANCWHKAADTFPSVSSMERMLVDGSECYNHVFFEELKTRICNGEWYVGYDIIEQVASGLKKWDDLDAAREQPQGDIPGLYAIEFHEDGEESQLGAFTADINEALERELSGYRLIGTQIVPITNEEELSSLELSLNHTDSFAGVRLHLGKALALFSRRSDPDYPNAVKESISAVESAAECALGSKSATLGNALKMLKKANPSLHPALFDGWSKLYGFTSDEGGIRHASADGSVKVDQAFAKYMLVSCSAFANYLIESCSGGEATSE